MLVRFSKSPATENGGIDHIIEVANSLGVWADIKWENDDGEVRFNLQPRRETWEAMIKAILEYDPNALVKTTRAIYRGKQDYLKQTTTQS